MPTYLVGSDGGLIGWGDSGPAPDLPPAAPTGVAAAPGNTEATVSWATPAEGDVVSHSVRRVNTDGSTTFVQTVAMPTLSLVVTGLTNGTQYAYVVRAIDAAGQTSSNSAQATVTPTGSPVQVNTIFGYNTNESGAPLSGRLVKWGNRAPMVRRYNGNNFLTTNTFNLTRSVYPEKRAAFGWKSGTGQYSTSGLAAGNGNSRMRDWIESIPAAPPGEPDWQVDLNFHHEPNFSGGMEVPPADFLNIYEQMRTTIDSATLQSGVVVNLCVNFMAYQIGNGVNTGLFRDAWVPDPSICDQLTWDVYLNPGNFTTSVLTPQCQWSGTNPVTGPEYGTSFPNTQTRHRDWMQATIRNGYGADGRWGIWEYNGPPRDWDGPTNPEYVCGSNKRLRYQGGRTAPGHDATHTEVERAAALVAGVEYFLSRPTFAGLGTLGLPATVLFWEHPEGVNWTQKFFHDNMWNALRPYVVNSP